MARLAMAPDGKTLALLTQGRPGEGSASRLTVLDLPSSKERHVHVLKSNADTCLTFTSDSKAMAVGSARRFDGLWLCDAQSGEMRVLAQFDGARCLAALPGTPIVIAGCWNCLERWSLADPMARLGQPHCMSDVAAVVLSPQGDLAAIREIETGKVHVWNTSTGERVHLLSGDSSSVIALNFCKSGKALAGIALLAKQERELLIWEIASGKLEKRVSLSKGIDHVFSADGNLLALGTEQGSIDVFNLETCTVASILPSVGLIFQLQFSPDKRCLAVLSREEDVDGNRGIKLRLHNLASGKIKHVANIASVASDRIVHLRFSPDGLLLFISDGSQTSLWEIATGQCLWTAIGKEMPALAFDFTPDGLGLLALDSNRHFHLVDLSTRKATALPAGDGQPSCLGLSGDGKILVTGYSNSFTALVLQEARIAKGEVGLIIRHPGRGTALVWSLDAFLAASRTKPTQISDQELSEKWASLASGNSKTALAACLSLAKDKGCVAFLRQHLKPAPFVTADQVAQWIKDLDSSSYKVRSQAMNGLESIDEIAESPLQAALAAKPSLELRRRIELLLNKLRAGPAPAETLQKLRAIGVLQTVGGAEARAVLQVIADGASGFRVTVAAQAALDRMK